jgi:DUF4097 and DUF4098 domain-containing protein YvlB
MSKAKIVTIVCWILTAAILIGLGVWFLTGNLFRRGGGFHISGPFSGINISTLTGPYNEVGSYSVPSGDIRSLDVDWTAGAAKIIPYDGSDIKVTEYAQRELRDNEKLVYKISGGTLEVNYIAPGLSINMITKNLEVLVPKALAAELDRLSVDATSADVTIADFTVKTLDIQETSGTADLDNVKSDEADIGSVSGTITLDTFTAARLTMETTSGEMLLTDATVDNLKSNSVSGGHELQGSFQKIDSGSVSGEIRISSSVNPEKIHCNTTSGGIVVTLPGNADLSVNYNTVSGHFSSEVAVKNAGSAPYNFSTVSGNITLKAA